MPERDTERRRLEGEGERDGERESGRLGGGDEGDRGRLRDRAGEAKVDKEEPVGRDGDAGPAGVMRERRSRAGGAT